jgi:hypothetical protein
LTPTANIKNPSAGAKYLVVNHVNEGGKIRASSVLARIAGGRSEFEFFKISKIDSKVCFTVVAAGEE